MEKNTEILNELQQIAPTLAGLQGINVYSVPAGYFEQLSETIRTIIFLTGKKEIGITSSPPEGYFTSLSDKILEKIRSDQESADEEIRQMSPALHYLRQEAVFSVPENYFDNLADRIVDKVKSDQPAKVISINSRKNWWRYAAVAVIAAIIAVGSLLIFNNSNDLSHMPAYIRLSEKYRTPAELQQGIASLSTDEIANYLEKNTTVLDDESLINNTNTNALPAPDDYLLNDDALNDYLKTINAQALMSKPQ